MNKNPTFINDCQNVMRRYFLINLPEDHCQKIWEKDLNFRVEYKSAGIDTYVREWLIDIFCELFVEMTWPAIGDNPVYKNTFYMKLRESAKIHGFTVDF